MTQRLTFSLAAIVTADRRLFTSGRCHVMAQRRANNNSHGLADDRTGITLDVVDSSLFTGGDGLDGLGCLLSNVLSGAILLDVVFGSLASLLGAIGTYGLRKSRPFLGTIPPILANTIIVPLILRYGYGDPLPIPFMMLTVGMGEIISCGVLGILLYTALKPMKAYIFEKV